MPLQVMVRLGRWQELLDEPRPDDAYLVLTAMWHHAHGLALAAVDARFRQAWQDAGIELTRGAF